MPGKFPFLTQGFLTVVDNSYIHSLNSHGVSLDGLCDHDVNIR